MNYLNRKRIEVCKELLENTDYGISDIAHLTGFSSQSYLSQSFRKSCGMTAGTYRKLKKKERILFNIMQYTFPNYYKEFSCIAGACPDTCCAGWQIVIDDQTLKKYQHFKGPFRNRLHNDIDWKEHVFRQYNRRCAFLNEENLCDIYTEAGPEMFCRTCRNYPRHMEEFDGLREGSLSLSCIEAAKIILGCKDPVQFITMEDDTEDEEDEEFDFLLFTKLMDAREAILKMLQNREVDICVRMGMVLNLSKEIQIAVDHGELFQIDELLKDFGEMDSLLEIQKQIGEDPMGENEYCSEMRKMFRTFSKLEVLKEDWPEYVRKAERLSVWRWTAGIV